MICKVHQGFSKFLKIPQGFVKFLKIPQGFLKNVFNITTYTYKRTTIYDNEKYDIINAQKVLTQLIMQQLGEINYSLCFPNKTRSNFNCNYWRRFPSFIQSQQEFPSLQVRKTSMCIYEQMDNDVRLGVAGRMFCYYCLLLWWDYSCNNMDIISIGVLGRTV